MKKILLLLFSLLISAQSFAQDPELYQTWYLVSYSYDLGPTYYVNDVEPRISPTLVIDENLNFEGLVCNEYGGYFSYDQANDFLILEDFGPCLCGTCNNPPQSHVDLENDYFEYFSPTLEYQYLLNTNPSTNVSSLMLFAFPGHELVYSTEQLSVQENTSADFKIYPNPVSDQLFISSENLQIENINIYSMSGKEIMNFETNEKAFDVSTLSKGIYFIEVTSQEGTSSQRFIKE